MSTRAGALCGWRSPPKGSALVLCLSLATVPAWAGADSLAEPPASWQGRIRAVPESDTSGAEPLVQQAIREARDTLSTRLAQPAPDLTALANSFGQLGAIYQLHEVQAAAELCYENARQLQPEDFRWPYYGGYLALRAGQTEKALQAFLAAQSLRPDYPPLALRFGEVWLEKGDITRARTLFEQAAREPGLQSAALYYLGQIATLDRRFEAAVEQLEQALRLNPQASEVHYPLAQAYRALGRDDLAREHLGRFRQRIPTAEDPLISQLQGAVKRSIPLFSRGMQAINDRDYLSATQWFAQGLAVDPDNGAARVSYARALFLAGETAGAERELRAALSRRPDLSLARYLLGVLQEAAGQSEEAATAYRETLRLEPGHAGAHFALGNLLFRRGLFGEAAEHYSAALAADRDVTPAQLLRLLALRSTGASDATLAKELDDRIATRPQDPALAYAKLRLLALSPDPAVRNPPLALEWATALALQQPFPPYLEALAVAYAATGRFTEAAETQQTLIGMMTWMAPPGETERLRRSAARYQTQQAPDAVWPADDPLLQPPPFDPMGPFRDYPAALPF